MRRILWLWRFGAKNLLRNRRRNVITGGALAVAYAGILVFTGYIVWVEKFLRADTVYINQLGHLLIERPNALAEQLTMPQKALMTAEEQKQVAQILAGDPAVAMTGRGLASQLLVIHGCQSRGVMATGRDLEVERRALQEPAVLRWNYQLIHPEIFEALAKLQAASPDAIGVMPTPDLSHRLAHPSNSQCREPEPPAGNLQLLAKTIDGYTGAAEAQVVGDQTTGIALLDSRTLYLPINKLQKLLETDRVGYISVFAHSPLQIPGLYRRLSTELEKLGSGLVVIPFFNDEAGLYYSGSMAFLAAMATFFVVLVTAVVGLTLLSLFSITIAERGSEIGVLMALGFPWQQILHLFEVEAVLLTLTSLSIGLVLALGASFAINTSRIAFYPPGVSGTTWLTIAWEPAIVLIIGAAITACAWLAVKYITRRKLKESAVSLLQGSTTL